MFISTLIFLFSFVSTASELNITDSGEFQFVHCVTSSPGLNVDHYVIDIRNENKHALYFDTDKPKTNAKNLKNLKLIDTDLDINTLSDFDVSWISIRNSLVFQLNIVDNGGYVMDGFVVHLEKSVPVRCVDSSLE
jgi:hypothetical protein